MKTLLVLTLALTLSGCASALKLTVTTETAGVQAVHLVVTEEANASKAGLYDFARHQQYVANLRKVTRSEKELNDALLVWANAPNSTAPAIVADAVAALLAIQADLFPLSSTHPALAGLAAAVASALAKLSGGAQ